MEWQAYPSDRAAQEQNLAWRNVQVASIARRLIASERARTQRVQPLDQPNRRAGEGQERWPFTESGPS